MDAILAKRIRNMTHLSNELMVIQQITMGNRWKIIVPLINERCFAPCQQTESAVVPFCLYFASCFFGMLPNHFGMEPMPVALPASLIVPISITGSFCFQQSARHALFSSLIHPTVPCCAFLSPILHSIKLHSE